jgi:hypothetical protein
MAEINVPAPKAITTPSVRFPNENLEAIIPPKIKEEVANKPHKNAFNIQSGYYKKCTLVLKMQIAKKVLKSKLLKN